MDRGSDRGLTPAQVALAWLHHQVGVYGIPVVPIPGTRSPERAKENFAAASVDLTQQELDMLEPIAAQVQGDRYPDMRSTANARN